jgi:ankyrin repeat protein
MGETLLHLACRNALVPVVAFLINEVGVPVNVHDDTGRNPLDDAFWIFKPNTELIDLIVSKCPDLLFVQQDKRGHSPLACARRTHWGQWNKYVNSRSDTLEPAFLLNVRKQ